MQIKLYFRCNVQTPQRELSCKSPREQEIFRVRTTGSTTEPLRKISGASKSCELPSQVTEGNLQPAGTGCQELRSGSEALIEGTNRAAKGSVSQPLTLPEKDVTHSCVNVVIHWVSTVDHQAIHKLHGLGTLTSEFAGHNHLATLGTALHDEAEDTIAGSAGRKQQQPQHYSHSAKSTWLRGGILHQFQAQTITLQVLFVRSLPNAHPVNAMQSSKNLHTVLAVKPSLRKPL